MKRKRKPGPTPKCKVLPQTFRDLRVDSGLTQQELAMKLGLGLAGTMQIGNWENNRGRPNSDDQLKMVQVFHNCKITLKDLLKSGFGEALLKRAGIINEAEVSGCAKWEDFEEAERIPIIWKREVKDCESSFWATNHLRQDFFEQKIAEEALGEQQEKRNAAIGINKILIADDENELKELYEEMKKQEAAKLAPKWILREWIECGKLKEMYDCVYDGLGFKTFDFQIFDSSRVFFWLLEEGTRKPTGGKRLSGGSECQAFVAFYKRLFKAAAWFKPKEGPSQFKDEIERWRLEKSAPPAAEIKRKEGSNVV